MSFRNPFVTDHIYQATEELKEGDSRTIFFTKEIHGVKLVLIPKSKHKISETESTYVLEMIGGDVKWYVNIL